MTAFKRTFDLRGVFGSITTSWTLVGGSDGRILSIEQASRILQGTVERASGKKKLVTACEGPLDSVRNDDSIVEG